MTQPVDIEERFRRPLYSVAKCVEMSEIPLLIMQSGDHGAFAESAFGYAGRHRHLRVTVGFCRAGAGEAAVSRCTRRIPASDTIRSKNLSRGAIGKPLIPRHLNSQVVPFRKHVFVERALILPACLHRDQIPFTLLIVCSLSRCRDAPIRWRRWEGFPCRT
jgi:hypothetical protein